MIDSSTAARLLAGVLLVLTAGLGVYLARHTAGVDLTVQSTRGDATRTAGGILLPGMTVSAGETVRTHRGPLELRNPAGDLQVHLNPASRLLFAGTLGRAGGTHLWHGTAPDAGRSYTDGPRIVHRWNRARLVQDHGRLGWRWRPPRLELTVGRDLRAHWKLPGGTLPLAAASASDPPSVRLGADTGPLFPVREPPLAARRNTSLIAPDDLMDRLAEHARERGIPDRLPAVFGHWVRDRWGTVYLYLPGENGFRVISAGPDGRFHTPDDRRWRRRVSRTESVS